MNSLRSLLEDEIPHLRRYARALTRAREDADDLVQACLERALQNADKWDPSRPLRPWLFRIQHNIYVSSVRRQESESNYASKHPAPQSDNGNQYDNVRLGELQCAIERLPPEQRSILLLVALEGLSYQEVAELLSIPVGTVRSRLSRSREALREAMETRPAATAERGGGP